MLVVHPLSPPGCGWSAAKKDTLAEAAKTKSRPVMLEARKHAGKGLAGHASPECRLFEVAFASLALAAPAVT